MARVVQQRGTPPYLLILLVLLFLCSTTLAILFYVRYDEKVTALEESETSLDKKAVSLRDETTQKLRLIKLITGREGKDVTGEVAADEADQALAGEHAKAYKNEGLAAAINGLEEVVRGYIRESDDLKSRLDDQDKSVREKDKTIADWKAKYDALSEQSRSDLAAARDGFRKGLAAKDAQLSRAVAGQTDALDKNRTQISTLTQQVDDAQQLVRQRDGQIEQYLKIIADLRGLKARPGEAMMRKPDGKIAKVLAEQQVVYINLGEKDRVTPGLPFTVYSSQTGVPEDGEGKAQIVINNVFSTISECRIVQAKKDDPIIEGDLVANVVFDPTRTYNFVVQGEFDLYGEGRPDPAATQRVRSMIERFGGKVVDEVAVTTDFVVVGAEPPRPPDLTRDARPGDLQLYKEKMEIYNRYQQVKTLAATLQIPTMNTNRFLAFTGLVPKKRLSE